MAWRQRHRNRPTGSDFRVQSGRYLSRIDRRQRRSVGLESLEPRHLLASVVISEVHYHPRGPSDVEVAAGFNDADDFEFVEIANVANTPVDISNLQLAKTSVGGEEQGVEFDFATGSFTTLAAGQRAIVVGNQDAFAARYGNSLPVVGEWSGSLGDDGETITLLDGNGIVQQFAYDDDWIPSTDGEGYSLEIIDVQNPDLSVWGTRQGWNSSVRLGGTPGQAVEDFPLPGDVNGDGRFNQQDFDLVQAAGKYATGEPATFEQGDWNGDGLFDSDDIIHALSFVPFELDHTPRGNADTYSLMEDGQLVIDPAGGVLANDEANSGDLLTARLSLAPAWGQLNLQSDGSFTYVPRHDFSGADTFVYVPLAGGREGVPTTVELNVTPINDPPLARGDFHFTRPATPLVVSADEGVLSNDVDGDSLALTAVISSQPQHGILQLADDGSFSYTPAAGFRGMDRFSYRASDGSLESASATVSISVNPQQILVSEFAASVQTSFRDFDNDSSDWIEVTNFDSVPVNLQGWYLTDDDKDLTRWQVPVETIVEPGQSLIIVASGKDFVAPTGELHTDFRLTSDGEYLALVGPDGTSVVWDAFPAFPQLAEDISYGLTATTTTRQLITASSPARVLLPQDDQLGREWTAIEFSDADWSPAAAAIGYTTQLPQTVEPGFTARMLKIGAGRVRILETARAAESLFEGTAVRGDYVVSQDVTVVLPSVNFGGATSVTPGGDFPEAFPYPDGTTLNSLNDFTIRVGATVTIPEGDWTIGFGSSDGGLLRLDGIQFLETTGEAGDTEIVADDGEIIFNETRTKGWTTATFTVPAGGLTTTLDGIFFERRGADFFEIAISPGHVNSKPITRNGWMLLEDGVMGWQVETVNVPARPDFDPLFRSDLQSEMFDQASSAYVRIPFDVADASALNRLELRMRYDDGFVAYLNGTEVARDNVTGPVAGNSQADSDRSDTDAGTPTTFDLSAHVSLLRDGTNVLAIQGLNADPHASGFFMDPELIAISHHPVNPAYMPATPGTSNALGGIGVLDPPEFSVQGGTFREAFVVQLTSSDPRGTIRFTTDGSVPNENSMVYTEPIEVLYTLQLRARTFLPDHLPSATATELFLRLGADIEDFNSNLPLLVFDTFGQEIPGTASTYFGDSMAAVFELPEGGRSSFDAQPSLISRAGIRLRGSSSASYEKKPYRFEFRQDQNDEDRDVDIVGLPTESDFNLVPGYLMDLSLNRNTVVYDLSNQVGQYAARTKYVEVFVSSERGELTREAFVGVYPVVETIKVGANRLDIGKMSPQYTTEPLVTGGYIIKADKPAPGDNGIVVGIEGRQYPLQLVEPSEDELEQNPAQMEYLTNYLTDIVIAAYAPDFTHPELGLHYSDLLDVESFIDHYVLGELWQSTDALFFSGFYYKPRDGKLHAGPVWDFNQSAGSPDARNDNPRRWHVIDSAPFIWPRLFVDLEFRQAFVDRWSELHADVLSHENLFDTYDRVTGQIAEAAERNFERFTKVPPRSNGGTFGVLDGTWAGEALHMRLWLEARLHWMNSLFLQAPQFATVSGPGDDEMLTVTLRGDFNRDNHVDATDMAFLSGEVLAGTNQADFDLTGDGILDHRDLLQMAKLQDTVAGDADLDGDVDADDQAIYMASEQRPPGGDPPTWLDGDFDGDGDVDQTDGDLLTQNLGFDRHELNPVGEMIYYTTDGSDPRLPGGGISPTAIPFDGSIDLPALTTIKARAYDADFNIPVRGFEQPEDDPEAWSGLTTWIVIASSVMPADSLRVTEVNYHPADPTPTELTSMPQLDDGDFEFIRLTNLSSDVLNLAGVRFSAGVVFDFVNSDIKALGPLESVLVVSNRAAFELRYGTESPVAGEYTGQLNNAGEELRLEDAAGLIQEFAYSDGWYGETDGAGSFLQIINPASEDLESWNNPASWRAAT